MQTNKMNIRRNFRKRRFLTQFYQYLLFKLRSWCSFKYAFNALFIWCLAALSIQCTADKLPVPETQDCTDLEPTYESNVKEIIDRTCAYTGCHLDVAPGIYLSYEGDLLASLNSGEFRKRVVSALRTDPIIGMPQDIAPAGRQKDLTPEELELITCWLDRGFPKN